LRTICIQRSKEDNDEDMAAIKDEVDLFIDGRNGLVFCSLGRVTDKLLE